MSKGKGKKNYKLDAIMKFAKGAGFDYVEIPAQLIVEVNADGEAVIKAASGVHKGGFPPVYTLVSPTGEGREKANELIRQTYGDFAFILVQVFDPEEAQGIWEIMNSDPNP